MRRSLVTVTDADLRELNRIAAYVGFLRWIAMTCLIFSGITLPWQIALAIARYPLLPSTSSIVLCIIAVVTFLVGILCASHQRTVAKREESVTERVRRTRHEVEWDGKAWRPVK